jgi:hypothetical protein
MNGVTWMIWALHTIVPLSDVHVHQAAHVVWQMNVLAIAGLNVSHAANVKDSVFFCSITLQCIVGDNPLL